MHRSPEESKLYGVLPRPDRAGTLRSPDNQVWTWHHTTTFSCFTFFFVSLVFFCIGVSKMNSGSARLASMHGVDGLFSLSCICCQMIVQACSANSDVRKTE